MPDKCITINLGKILVGENRMMTEVEANVFDEDMNDGKPPERLSQTSCEAKRMTEVHVRPWIANVVVSTCDRAGIVLERMMTMQWICTWKPPKELGGARRAKARLVVRAYTDPDLTTVRFEAPTISCLERQALFQAWSPHLWSLYKGDVKTAFHRGGKGLRAPSIATLCLLSERRSPSPMPTSCRSRAVSMA